MAYRGQTVNNPVTGETITFLATTADTDGERLVFDCLVEPGKPGLPAHRHRSQSEHFTVLSGTLRVTIGKKSYTLYPGDRALLPPGIAHSWRNGGRDVVRFRVEARPAENLEATIETICSLAAAGKLNRYAMPRNPIELAAFGKLSGTYLPGIPVSLQKLGLNAGSTLARLSGIDTACATDRSSAAPTATSSMDAEVEPA